MALISFAVTAKLICVFVFAYADCWFSHEAAHFCLYVATTQDPYMTNGLAHYYYLDVVLTAGKRDAKAVLRLERKYTSEINNAHVHQVTTGPYKGMLIDKAPDGLTNVDEPEFRLEFLAYLVNQERQNETLQDYWTLRFWYKGKADGLTKKRTFTQFFQDLMNPANFPKNFQLISDYMSLMKKALTLLKSYSLIKRVELEVEEIKDNSVTQSIPAIKSFISLYTPDIYQYCFVPEVAIDNKTFLTFMIKAKADTHLALAQHYGDLSKHTIEILIGSEGNAKSVIKEGVEGQIKAEALTLNILSEKELRYFWISWGENHIEVGCGPRYGHGRFLDWRIPTHKQFKVTSLAVTTDNTSHGQFEFAELLDLDTDYSKQAKKARFQKKLMWLAKKQRMLQCLEEVYPSTMSAYDIIQLSRVRGLDLGITVGLLRDLEKLGLIKEVETGRWLRIQRAGQNGHELKLVKDMPQLTGKEQPTVAIITSLYCEKLAVDSMIDDKTTFVKYKTDRDTQVYTVGTVGRTKVVCTKLSCTPGSPQAAIISAENTVTRLLGTFNKVEHVLLVGVAGGVPNPTDFVKHVNIGDIVISIATDKNCPLCIHCQKIENSQKGGGYAYSTRRFESKNRILQNICNSLKAIVEVDWLRPRPWDVYLEQGREHLIGQEFSFQRPSKGNKIMVRKNDGTAKYVEAPKPTGRNARGYKETSPTVRYGVIGSGKLVSRSHHVRQDFANINNIKAFDMNLEAILESLEGNRNESFLVIRGICDYVDGSNREWQPYAALAAAGYMKSLLMAL